MGDRGSSKNAGYAAMLRVWCPKCGFSYFTGQCNPRVVSIDRKRPERVCSNKERCAKRALKRYQNSHPGSDYTG